jgi:hypothetical protein
MVHVPVDTGGRPFLECRFVYRLGKRVFGPVSASAVSPVITKGSSRLDPGSPFGMGIYLYRYGDTPEGWAAMEKAAQMAMAAGVKWSREEFYWGVVQRERGSYDWRHYDKVVDTATAHGISIYGLIDYWNDWTNGLYFIVKNQALKMLF